MNSQWTQSSFVLHFHLFYIHYGSKNTISVDYFYFVIFGFKAKKQVVLILVESNCNKML